MKRGKASSLKRGIRDSDGLHTGRSVFDSRQGQEIFLYSTASRPALRPTHPRIQWVPGVPRGVRLATDQYSPYVFVAWCLIKHRDVFAFAKVFTFVLAFLCRKMWNLKNCFFVRSVGLHCPRIWWGGVIVYLFPLYIPSFSCISVLPLVYAQCHYHRHNATQSHIYILLFLSQHVSASVGHLQVLPLTPKLLYSIDWLFPSHTVVLLHRYTLKLFFLK
jgi:hypothetical protein